jgi:NAD-dependent SIR2 family protein deacetylase
MTKIVDIHDQLERKKKKEHLEKYRGRLDSIQKIIQCSSCRFRCAMCGAQVPPEESAERKSPGLNFCGDCRAEFEEFVSVTKGKKPPEVFWHNQEWVEVWRAWLDYRKAISAFVASKEYTLLVEELNSDS